MTDAHQKREVERRLRALGAGKQAAVIAVARVWRHRWVARFSPALFFWLAKRETKW